MYFVIYDYTQHHILHTIYWAMGQGLGPLAQGPRYTGDYANYISYTIYHILDIIYCRIETRH